MFVLSELSQWTFELFRVRTWLVYQVEVSAVWQSLHKILERHSVRVFQRAERLFGFRQSSQV